MYIGFPLETDKLEFGGPSERVIPNQSAFLVGNLHRILGYLSSSIRRVRFPSPGIWELVWGGTGNPSPTEPLRSARQIPIFRIAALTGIRFLLHRLFPQQQSQKLAVGEGIGTVGTVQNGVQILRIVFDLLGPQLGIAPKIPRQAPHQQG